MIERYTRAEMGQLWSLENKFKRWLSVEIAVCEVLAENGDIPQNALNKIKEKAGFDLNRILEIEKTVKHDVIAFLTSVAEYVGPEARYIHLGLTSSDVLDTAQALIMKDACSIIIDDINAILEVLKDQAMKTKGYVCIGRSHGVHAEPMVFGLKFALWYEEMKRNLERMERALNTISVGKVSGAVGTFSAITPDIEERVCKRLGLTPEPIATQVVQRDRHAELLTFLAIVASTIEKIAIEIRHLQRTEVREAEEPFSKGQKGSSAMPHKRNPVGCENLTGLSRIVRSNALAGLENVALWHERDISHSSTERVILPDSTILVDYMLVRLTGILKNLHIYPENMEKNLQKSYGLYNSQKVLLAITKKGLDRDVAYELVQKNAMESWRRGEDFKELLKADDEVTKHLTDMDIDGIFDIKEFLKHIDAIYNRVFG